MCLRGSGFVVSRWVHVWRLRDGLHGRFVTVRGSGTRWDCGGIARHRVPSVVRLVAVESGTSGGGKDGVEDKPDRLDRLMKEFDQRVDDWFLDEGGDEEEDEIDEDEDGGHREELVGRRHKSRGRARRIEVVDMGIERSVEVCSGCGSRMQSDDEGRPGYVPPDVWARVLSQGESLAEEGSQPQKDTNVVCQRCHNLHNAAEVPTSLRVRVGDRRLDQETPGAAEDDRPLTPEGFRATLSEIAKIRSVVIYLVDVFDFHGSFLRDLPSIVGKRCTILLAVNKVDLLPVDFKAERVAQWVRQECQALGVDNVENIHLISGSVGLGVDGLFKQALALARRDRVDIYVIGAANVGKSTFLNQVMSRSRSDGDEVKKINKRELLTTSVIPGTTLNLIKIPLGGGRNLYDTPGVILPQQITNMLTNAELKAVVPQKRVTYVTFRVSQGKSLFIGGLARIDLLEGKAFFFTTFLSGGIKIHPSKTEGADEFLQKHAGSLLTPPFDSARLKNFGAWGSKTFRVSGVGWKKAAVDIVLSGLGWISVTGVGDISVRVTSPNVVGVFQRPPLMPFEIEKGASRFTGGSFVNPRRARKRN
eukprot:CAMPEP_0184687484 /NCGR_PEP_ID=MMETSP0312-20130426/26552_1 /TAXON_ID=31354 /ORGANISM="Compsopogon coeruleus, Strain SAG 36.94" /LENGTH=588 /DNA_ID=CAMNT_0027143681 /DNA_START=26 /DNA_END=1792 /DNA_ORIENTATION=+